MSFARFVNNTDLLARNHVYLEGKIKELEQLIKYSMVNDIGSIRDHYFMIQTIISQFLTSFQIIHDMLEKN